MHQEAISTVIRKYLWQALKLSFFHLKVLKTSYFAQQTSLGAPQGVRTCWPPQPGDYLDSIFPQKCPFDSPKHFLSSITHYFQSYAVATCGVWWAPEALFTPSEVYGHLGMDTHTHMNRMHIGGGSKKYPGLVEQTLDMDSQ